MVSATGHQADRALQDRAARYKVLPSASSLTSRGVIQVHDALRREDVAMRLIPVEEVSDESFARFQALFPILSQFDHPSLARVYDLGRTEFAAYYTRELAPEQNIVETLRGAGERVVVQALTGFAEGLAALHGDGIVHGLVVPDHLKASAEGGRLGSVRITDAGLHVLIPKALESYQGYLPPEVRAGAEVSTASDIYGLAASLIQALWGKEALEKLTGGWSKWHRSVLRGVGLRLHDLLGRLMAPDPRRRLADGSELLRALRDPAWVLHERQVSVEDFISPSLVGREQAMSNLRDALRRGARGEVHAVEIIGARGLGRTRLLREVAAVAGVEGWTSIWVEGGPDVDLEQLTVVAARKALGLEQGPAGAEVASAGDHAGDLLAPVAGEAGTAAKAHVAEGLRQAVDASHGRLLVVADNADTLSPDLLATLRYLVTETGGRPILVLSSGAKPCGLPDGQVVEIGALNERDLRRLLAPLLTTALNPESAFAAIRSAAAGNPLWARLLLASWLESGRLRMTHGRPFFDEKKEADVPASMQESLTSLVATLGPLERELFELLAVWGKPIPEEWIAELIQGRVAPPAALVAEDPPGTLRFESDTFGPAILDALPDERRRHWHQSLVALLERKGAEPGARAVHLLGVGRIQEGVKDLIGGAEHAAERGAWHTAFQRYALALEHLDELDLGATGRVELVLRAARVAVGVGELRWASKVLEAIDLPAGDDEQGLRQRFDVLLARANVLREERDAPGAAELYGAARAMAREHATLHSELRLVDVEEAANDPHRGDVAAGLDRLAGVVEELRREGPPELLAVALNRLAALHMRVGHLREAVGLGLACARLSRRLGLPLVGARAFINLGNLYAQLVRPDRALRSLDRAKTLLAACPHDGLAASELVNRGDLLLDLRRYEEAETAFLHARLIRLRSGQWGRLPAVLVDLGRLRRLRGRLEEAERCYREAVALSEEFMLPTLHGARANLGELLYHQGELGEAERLMRLAAATEQPQRRGVGLINLGCVLRERGELAEALRCMDEAASLLRQSRSALAPLAGIEAAHTLLIAGDPDAAEAHLTQESMAVESPEFVIPALYHLVSGLLKAARREAPYVALDAAVATAHQAGDPTMLAEILITALDVILRLPEPDPVWVRKYTKELEEAAARTEARPVAVHLRRLRAEVDARTPAPGPGDRPAAELAAKVLAQETTPLGVSLRQLIGDLQGVAGAIVIVAGIGADGTLSVAPVPGPETAAKVPVRPYRIAAREFDRRIFRQALEETGGNVQDAARLLRIPLSTFRYRATKIGILGGQRRRRRRRTS